MKHHVSEWKPFSELRSIQRLEGKKRTHVFNVYGAIFEPLEVKREGNEILWRYNEDRANMDIPKSFETQFGVFNNHNRGEFDSWLGKDDYDGPMGKEWREIDFLRRNDYFLEGNYCDVFDCGEYVYAISNQTHLGLGKFKIVRIDKELNAVTMYNNWFPCDNTIFEYAGCFQNATGHGVIVSGYREIKEDSNEIEFQRITCLFSIDKNGNCSLSKEWNTLISSVNSIAAVGNYVYFGQNKMITRLDVLSGEMEYFTNKTDEKLASLVDE